MNDVIAELHNEFKKPYFPESYQMSNTEYLVYNKSFILIISFPHMIFPH